MKMLHNFGQNLVSFSFLKRQNFLLYNRLVQVMSIYNYKKGCCVANHWFFSYIAGISLFNKNFSLEEVWKTKQVPPFFRYFFSSYLLINFEIFLIRALTMITGTSSASPVRRLSLVPQRVFDVSDQPLSAVKSSKCCKTKIFLVQLVLYL